MCYVSHLRLSLHSILQCRTTPDLAPVWFFSRTGTVLKVTCDYSKKLHIQVYVVFSPSNW